MEKFPWSFPTKADLGMRFSCLTGSSTEIEGASKVLCNPSQWHSTCPSVCLKAVWACVQLLLQETLQLPHYSQPLCFPVHCNGCHTYTHTIKELGYHIGKALLTLAIKANSVLTRSSERSVEGDNAKPTKPEQSKAIKNKSKIWHPETQSQLFPLKQVQPQTVRNDKEVSSSQTCCI